MDAIARWYLGHRGAGTLVVEGHADQRGSGGHNDRLSQRRADAVRAHLLSAGVPDDSLRLEAHGERQPASDRGVGADEGDSKDPYTADRRVVFTILPKQPSSVRAGVR